MNDKLKQTAAQISKDNRALREASQRTDAVMIECLGLLEAAGMGKPGAPYGNTLLGMITEVCERLKNVENVLENGEDVGENAGVDVGETVCTTLSWTHPLCGVSHCGVRGDHRRCTVEDHDSFVVLTQWSRGDSFSSFKDKIFRGKGALARAKRAGERWISEG